MRILYFTHFVGPIARETDLNGMHRFLGAGQKVIAICDALISAGHEVLVVSCGAVHGTGKWCDPKAESILCGAGMFEVEYVRWYDRRFLYRFGHVSRIKRRFDLILKEYRPDLLVCYNISSYTVAAATLGRRRDIPVVLDYEDSFSTVRSHGWVQTLISRLEQSTLGRLNFQRMMNFCRGVIAVTPEMCAELPRGRPRFVVRGILEGRHDSPVAHVLEMNDGSDFRIGYSGGLTRDKGIDLLVDAVLRPECADIRCDIFGEGPLREALEAKVRRHGQEGRVRFMGFADRRTLIATLRRTHVLVNPHRVSGMRVIGKISPFKVVEYLALGRPILSSVVISKDDPMATYINFYDEDTVDAIVRGVLDIKKEMSFAERLAVAGREYAIQQFSASKVGGRLSDFFSEI